MTDNGDGTYTGSYTITGSTGTVSVSALLYTEGGFRGEYWDHHWTGSDPWAGTPLATTDDETEINFNWVWGGPSEASSTDWFALKFSGAIKAPTSDDYNFWHDVDDAGTLNFLGFNGDSDVSLFRNYSNSPSTPPTGSLLTRTLEAGKIYPFTLEMYEKSTASFLILNWETTSFTWSAMPASAFYKQ